jgi:putative endonuclease
MSRRRAPAGAWVVYMVSGARGALYTGITNSIERRLREHAGGRRAARWFRFGAPGPLRYLEAAADRGHALRREAAIKRLSRAQKLELIANTLRP